MAQLDAQHEHDPMAVIDDQRTDEHGQPVAWLWHMECYSCGRPLPDVQPKRVHESPQ